MQAPVIIYKTQFCAYCLMAKRLFDRMGVTYTEVSLDDKPKLRDELSRRHNWQTVPMIVVGETFVGGYTDVAQLQRTGELARLLEVAA